MITVQCTKVVLVVRHEAEPNPTTLTRDAVGGFD